MRVSHIQIGLVISALLGTAAPQQQIEAAVSIRKAVQPNSSAAQPLDWRKATRADVLAAYQIFSRHHPGMFDPRNPWFSEQLRRARDAALQFAQRIDDAEGHMRALALFSAVLSDGHARVQASYSGRGEMRWPGFLTVWRGDALHVVEPVENGPPPESVLVGCDGRGARDVLREAFWFHGRPDEEGQWWTNAHFFFQRVRSPYEELPRECSFRRPDGRTMAYSLNWRTMPRAVFDDWFKAASRREPISLTEPRPGVHLVTLPTFSPDEEGRAAYARLFAQLEVASDRIAGGRAIVIDLRGNGGGSWSWSRDLASRLWGEDAVATALAAYFRNTEIWWLADPVNIAHFRNAAAQLRRDGRTGDAAEYERVAANLAAAAKRGRRFYIQHYGDDLVAKAKTAAPRQLPPIYVIIDGRCASACLDALDLFTRFPRVKLVGAPTSADTNYLETRWQPLPSGRGAVMLPTKIWVNRPRGAGEVYRPDIPVNDLTWSTAKMLDHIERDLTR